jgi:maltose-binding protein MalE
MVDGPWARSELLEALGDDLIVTTLPDGPVAAAQPWLSADGLFLNPNPDATQQRKSSLLAQHLTGPAGGSTWAQVAGRLPAHQEADPGADPILRGFMQQAASARSMPSVPEMDEVWGYGGDMLLKVLNDVTDPQVAVREASALINEANGK